MMEFVHLHAHSHMSMLDALPPPERLAERARELGMAAMSITDHGNLHAAPRFHAACTQKGIKPILGIEFYCVPNVDEKDRQAERQNRRHLTVLAMNARGWKNLVRLSSLSFRRGFYIRPRIDEEMLFSHSEGLIVLSGCSSGELAQAILQDGRPAAARVASRFKEALGNRYYLELSALEPTPERLQVALALRWLSDEFKIPMVVTNDVHYMQPTECATHSYVTRMAPGRRGYQAPEIWMKDGDGVLDTFVRLWKGMGLGRVPITEAILRSSEVASRVEAYPIDLGQSIREIPVRHQDKSLRELIEARVPDNPEYRKQAEYELGVISDLGFETVFLACHDLCEFARNNGIRMGPGRGSAAGSLVCYLLGITHLDPILHKLDFSRFLVEGRVSPPDIDLDMTRDGREKLLVRLRDLVGEDRVARIATFSQLAERGALRDVARVLIEESPERYFHLERDIHRICSLIPEPCPQSLSEISKKQPLAAFREIYPKLFALAERFIGMPRHGSVHAAGVILSSKPLDGLVPMAQDEKDTGFPVIQWDMRDAEKLGLFKLDLLVINALEFIDEACRLAGVEVAGISPDDPGVFEAFARGDVEGIFQFEQGYVADIFREIGCDSFDDLVATNALLRPGAKATNSVQGYAKNKKSKGNWTLGVPEAARACVSETYGLILYQEQAMRIARVCAGFTIREADDLRKGIAKDYDTSRMKDKFLAGCSRNGLPDGEAKTLWKVLENAGRYMFNKAHSTCYSYIAYQQMWLKVNHARAFWVAMLNSNLDDEVKARRMASRLRKDGATIRNIRANRSRAKCWYDAKTDEVILGFLCLKGVGDAAAQELERINDAPTIRDWAIRVNRRIVNKSTRDLLIQNNVFGCWSKDEMEIKMALERPLRRGPAVRNLYQNENQIDLL